MVSNESVLKLISGVGAVRSFYSRLRMTVDWSGIVAIIVQALILALAFGTAAAVLLVVVASLVTAASLFGNSRDDSVNEKDGPRSWRNALANAGVATGFAASTLLIPGARTIFAVAAIASLAASISDSLSHEIGILFGGRPRLITTWNYVQPGENGGVSLVGTLVGIVSAFGLAALATFLGVIGSHGALLAGIAACAGNLIDSVLGATIERKGWIGNDGVNFSAVCSSAVLALVVLLVLNFT